MATTIWPTRTAALRAQLKNLDEIFARLWANEQPGSKRRDLLKKARAWLNDELQKLSEPEAPPPIDLPEPPASAFTVSTEPIEDHEPEYAAA